MNTDTGRIYSPEEMERRTDPEAFFKTLDEHQAEFRKAYEDGKIVPVSPQVARTMRLGQAEQERRKKARKSAREARKRNR